MRLVVFRTTQLALLAMVLWSAALLYRQSETLAGLEMQVDWLCIAFLFKGISVSLAALKFRELMLLARLKLRLIEWAGLSVIPSFHAYLSPAKTGHVMRALYLRKRHGLAYEHYGIVVLGVTLLESAVAAVLGLMAAVMLADVLGAEVSGFFALVFAAVCAAPVSLVLLLRLLPLPIRTRGWRVMNAAKAMATQPRCLARLTVLCAASVLGRTAGLYASFMACGVDLKGLPSIVLESARTISATISVTPSNIGISEGVIVATASLLGVPAAESFPGAVVSRLLSMALYVVLGAWFTRVFLAELTLMPAEREQSLAA